MSEKEKPKRGSRYGVLHSCLIFSLYPLLVLTLLVVGLIYWAIGGYVKPSLDAQYIPTAEYLLENPIELPQTDELGLNISFSLNMSFNNLLCFIVSSSIVTDFPNLRWSEIHINAQVVSRVQLDAPYVFHHYMPSDTVLCIKGYLNSGLHIIEFRAKEILFAEPYYTQRWAIEIP